MGGISVAQAQGDAEAKTSTDLDSMREALEDIPINDRPHATVQPSLLTPPPIAPAGERSVMHVLFMFGTPGA